MARAQRSRTRTALQLRDSAPDMNSVEVEDLQVTRLVGNTVHCIITPKVFGPATFYMGAVLNDGGIASQEVHITVRPPVKPPNSFRVPGPVVILPDAFSDGYRRRVERNG